MLGCGGVTPLATIGFEPPTGIETFEPTIPFPPHGRGVLWPGRL